MFSFWLLLETLSIYLYFCCFSNHFFMFLNWWIPRLIWVLSLHWIRLLPFLSQLVPLASLLLCWYSKILFFKHGHLCTRIAADLKLGFLLGYLLNIVSKAVFLILCFGTKVHVSGWYFVSKHANVFSQFLSTILIYLLQILCGLNFPHLECKKKVTW